LLSDLVFLILRRSLLDALGHAPILRRAGRRTGAMIRS
jgi:hypothetical protein